ncbi:MAG: hypothetical protein IPH62_19510 [Ignavibacteriae bacterium]|nr:hypothetical protein [Ignavibacteriota bacterium]
MSSQNTNRISPFEMVKNPAGLTNTDESLIFTYPFVIDKTLAKEWGPLLRDFFSVQITSQIKSANILNITSSVTSLGGSNHEINDYTNPSAKLYSSLNNMAPAGITDNTPAQQMMASLASLNQRQIQLHNREEIQQQLNNFKEFIKLQITNDPVYDNLRPIATPIIVENLLTVPLILGTKEIRMDSQVLFWILFLCLADSLELTSDTTLETVKNYIRKIPRNNFMNLLYNNSANGLSNSDPNKERLTRRIDPKEFTKSTTITGNDVSALQNAIGDNLDKYFRFISPIFNENRWLEEVGIGRASGSILQISASQLDLRNFQAEIMTKFSNLFMGFITKDVTRILQSLVYVLVDPHTDNIDFTLKYKNIADSLINLTTDNDSDDLFNAVLAGLYNISNGDSKILSPQNSEHMIRDIESFCNDLNRISIKENFDKIHSLRLSLSDLSLRNLLDFMDDLTTNITNLISVKKLITNFMIRVSNNNVTSNDIDNIDNNIYNIVRSFFENTRNRNDPQAIWDGSSIPAVFNSLTGINDSRRVNGFFSSVYSNLTELISFCFYYSFVGHLCEYFKELKCKIEIKRKNALSFPNYILVVPSEYILSLYNALAYRSFSNMIVSTERKEEKFSNIKAADNDIGRMMTLLNNRLKIPNIIVVDNKTKTIYYKWNYLNRTLKLNSTSISSYIKVQKNAIQMF